MREIDQDPIIQVIPAVGWGNLRLGITREQARRYLSEMQIEFSDAYDEFCFEIDEPYCILTFDAQAPNPLVQLVFGSGDVQVHGLSILECPLEDALHRLGVQSFGDTMWSNVDIDSEYHHGIQVSDKLRPTQAKAQQLIDTGTLWIKSMGLGLCADHGYVNSLVVRTVDNVPRIGCGPLTGESLIAAAELEAQDKKIGNPVDLKSSAEKRARQKAMPRRIALTLIALALIIGPGTKLFLDYQRWQKATRVIGKVVQLVPNADSPDIVTVEYLRPDASPASVDVASAMTNAREIGSEVELFYLPENPDRALTLLEKRDVLFDGYMPYVLLGGPLLALFLLAMAFPKYSSTDIHK